MRVLAATCVLLALLVVGSTARPEPNSQQEQQKVTSLVRKTAAQRQSSNAGYKTTEVRRGGDAAEQACNMSMAITTSSLCVHSLRCPAHYCFTITTALDRHPHPALLRLPWTVSVFAVCCACLGLCCCCCGQRLRRKQRDDLLLTKKLLNNQLHSNTQVLHCS